VLETPLKQYTGTFIDRLSNTTTTVLETYCFCGVSNTVVVVLESLSINVPVYCFCGVSNTVVVVLESLSINVPVYYFCGVMLETPQKQYTGTFIDRLSNTTTTVLETPQKQYTGTFIDRLSNTTTTVLETPQKRVLFLWCL
jgi:hypothetical protein